MSAPIQLIGAKRRSQQSLQCLAEASPKPINYWTFGTGEMIVANDKFIVQVQGVPQRTLIGFCDDISAGQSRAV